MRFLRITDAQTARQTRTIAIVSEDLRPRLDATPGNRSLVERLTAQGRIRWIPSMTQGRNPMAGLKRALAIDRVVRQEGISAIQCDLTSEIRLLLRMRRGPKSLVVDLNGYHVPDGLFGPRKIAYVDRVTSFWSITGDIGRHFRELATQRGKAYLNERLEEAPSPFFWPAALPLHPGVEKQRTVVYAARFAKEKGPLLFAEAAAKFVERNPDWNVVMVGGGPEEAKVRELIQSSGRADAISLPGFGDPTPHLAAGSLFFSHTDGSNYPSQSILEAMFYGNAILTTEGGDSARMLHGNGRLVPGTPAAVGAALDEMVADPEALREMGALSRQVLQTVWSSDAYLDSLDAHYAKFGILGR
jgi:glycosyltransferase involved in cell wall biosynthesis